ncbi:uncharacterized protein KY384_001399 [Bacidia gigantensis]|uniref:uncharacterized protein n=1 Tax=Bacidia gigantensis TaxID=2732470 RepID=UPI001D04FB60|nr:uncharacterized protein KY384_001399 [Bacidia gigantensis]KAG8533658.1 hypothetical protein KY384_001399 [Bacidia gigantensis]
MAPQAPLHGPSGGESTSRSSSLSTINSVSVQAAVSSSATTPSLLGQGQGPVYTANDREINLALVAQHFQCTRAAAQDFLRNGITPAPVFPFFPSDTTPQALGWSSTTEADDERALSTTAQQYSWSHAASYNDVHSGSNEPVPFTSIEEEKAWDFCEGFRHTRYKGSISRAVSLYYMWVSGWELDTAVNLFMDDFARRRTGQGPPGLG